MAKAKQKAAPAPTQQPRDTSTITTLHLHLDQLVETDLNMRQRSKPDETADKHMRASLKHLGVLQNFIVHEMPGKKTLYGVAAGGRRLRLCRELAKAGEIDPDKYPIPCKVVPREDALSASIAENYHRVNPHPVDEFVAFKRMVDEGMAIKSVAEEFGVGVQYIRQRLALGAVHPKILDAYLDGKLSLDRVQAYTVVEDQARQLSVFKGAKDWWQPGEIRSKLTSEITQKDGRIKFIGGLKAYQDAGGRVAGDLFGSDGRILDIAILDKLVEAKFAAQIEQLQAEGWAWVEVDADGSVELWKYDREKPKWPKALKAELTALQKQRGELFKVEPEEDEEEAWQAWEKLFDEIEEKIDNFEQDHADELILTAKQKANSGVLIRRLRHNDEITIERGLIKPSAKGKAAKKKDKKGKADEAAEYSQSLVHDIGHHRKRALQLELIAHPLLAIELLWFTVTDDAFNGDYGTASFIKIQPRDNYSRRSESQLEQSHKHEPADIEFEKVLASLPLNWALSDDVCERFRAWRKLTAPEQQACFAAAIAMSVSIRARTAEYTQGSDGLANLVCDELEIDFAKYFRPTADNFFKRVTVPVLIGTLRDTDRLCKGEEKSKKSTLVKRLHALFGADDDMRPDWLPAGFK